MTTFAPSTFYSQKLNHKQITIDLTPEEAEMLELYCHQTGKSVEDVIEQLINELPES